MAALISGSHKDFVRETFDHVPNYSRNTNRGSHALLEVLVSCRSPARILDMDFQLARNLSAIGRAQENVAQPVGNQKLPEPRHHYISLFRSNGAAAYLLSLLG